MHPEKSPWSRFALPAVFGAALLTAGAGSVADASAAVPGFVAEGQLQTLSMTVDAAFDRQQSQMLFGAEALDLPKNTDAVIGGMNLWLGDLGSGETRRLVDGQGVLGAAFDPVSARVFYWTQNKEVFVVGSDGENVRPLLENAVSPVVSPDGRELAYIAVPADWHWNDHVDFELRVRDLESGAERVLVRGDDPTEPVWTPDGSAILYRSSRTSLVSLWKVDARGGEPRQLTNRGFISAANDAFVPNIGRNTDSRWSADGRRLLYGARYSEGGEVMVIEFDALYEATQALDLGSGRNPVWSGSDTVLAVAGAEKSGLVELTLDAERARKVVEITDSPAQPTAHFEPSLPELGLGEPDLGESDLGFEFDVEALAQKATPRFRFPLSYHPVYTSYYDNKSGGGLKDWKCGDFTYEGHQGTDIGAPCWTLVYTSATGTVSGRVDGCGDGWRGNTCGGSLGNYIKLNHGSYWYTYSAHLKSGTPVSWGHKGCGWYLGYSGTSGNSSGCHLHFEVRKYGYPNDDPFSGSCSGPESYWCSQGSGNPSKTCCY